MRTIVIFYRGTELPNLTKSMIAKQLVDIGIDVNSIDMTTFDDEETATIFTNAVNNAKADDATIEARREEELHHACVYVKNIIGSNISTTESFIITALQILHSHNEKDKTLLRNAFSIIATNDKHKVVKQGLRSSQYQAIVELLNHNLV